MIKADQDTSQSSRGINCPYCDTVMEQFEDGWICFKCVDVWPIGSGADSHFTEKYGNRLRELLEVLTE